MSILRYKQKLLADGGVARGGDGGGGGGGGPTQTTSYNTNIPEYAQPYVTGMLEATQKQIYNDDRTSFRPYQPYSSDVNNYFAGFSPLQQRAQQSAYNMQQPGQFALGSGLAGAAGIGSAMAGQQYAQQATDPRSMQAYMSPYMQNVVDYQKSQALRDYQMGQPMRQAQAVGQGAFGGSRQAIQEAEAQRGLMSQLQGIQATGTQQAFQNAQQAQQFGANLGLQGYGQALSAAGQLGQLGSQQQAADIAMQNQQANMGKQQQDLEQQKINQAIQNYAIQQQYPMMQLGFMSNMLRGLPLQAQTTQLYQAQPSTAQQAIGLLGAGSTLFGKKEGGIINYKEGGEVGYKYGGAIPEAKLAGMADNLSVEQLQAKMRDPALTPGERQIFADALQEKMQEQARYAGIAQAGGPAFEQQGMAGGGIIAFADTGLVDLEEALKKKEDEEAPKSALFKPMFGSFSSNLEKAELKAAEKAASKKAIPTDQAIYQDIQGSSQAPTTIPTAEDVAAAAKAPSAGPAKAAEAAKAPEQKGGPSVATTRGSSLADLLEERRALGPKGKYGEDLEKFIDERLGKSGERYSRDEKMAIAKGFLKFGATPAPGGIGQAAIAGLGEYATGIEAARKAQDTMEMEAQKMRADIEKARRAEERGDIEGAQKAYDSAADRQNRIQAAQISASATAAAANRPSERERIAREFMTQNPGMTFEQAINKASAAMTTSDEARMAGLAEKAMTAYQTALAPGGAAYGQYQKILKDQGPEAAKQFANELYTTYLDRYKQAASSLQPGGAAPTSGKVDTNNPLLKG